MNMLSMANLSVMGISPEAHLLAAQIAAAAGGFGQSGLGVGAGLGTFGGLGGLVGMAYMALLALQRPLARPGQFQQW